MRNRMGAGVIAMGVLLSVPVAAQPAGGDERQDQPRSLTGTWVMLIEGHQVGLELEDKAGTLEGTLYIMGQRVLVDGAAAEGRFTLTSESQIGDAQSHGQMVKINIRGQHKADDTLEGEIDLPRGPLKWTAERLKTP